MLRRYIIIRCDWEDYDGNWTCSNSLELRVDKYVDALNESKKSGWFRKDGGDFCPEHNLFQSPDHAGHILSEAGSPTKAQMQAAAESQTTAYRDSLKRLSERMEALRNTSAERVQTYGPMMGYDPKVIERDPLTEAAEEVYERVMKTIRGRGYPTSKQKHKKRGL